MKLLDLIIYPNDSLRYAMERMTKNKKGILLVCDHDFHLVGIISDGDIRRKLIDGVLLTAHIGKIMNTSPLIAKNPEEARKIINHTGYVVVPILDEEGFITSAAVFEGENIFIIEREEEIKREKIDEMASIAIIPARGGSKRIPKKNIQKIGGKPLIYWSILQAKASKYIKKIIVSTDDLELKEIALKYGAEVPWMRPKELAEDHTPTIDVLLNVFQMMGKESDSYKISVLLEPTAPLRLPIHIDNAIEKLFNSDADCVLGVCEIPHVLNPEELLVIEKGKLKPYIKNKEMDQRNLRGKQTPVYVQSGLVYAFKIKSLLENKSLYGKKCLPLIIDWEFFLDIDTKEDLEIANFKIRKIYEKYEEEFKK